MQLRIAIVLILLMAIGTADAFQEEGDQVYINDSQAYIKAPKVTGDNTFIIIKVISKLMGGNFNFGIVVNNTETDYFKPLEICIIGTDGELCYENMTIRNETFDNNTQFYTIDNLWIVAGWEYDIKIKYEAGGIGKYGLFGWQSNRQLSWALRNGQYIYLDPYYDISKALSSEYTSVVGYDGNQTDFTFNNESKKLYIGGPSQARVFVFNLTSPYAIGTKVIWYNVSILPETALTTMAFNENGSSFYYAGTATDWIREWKLTNPYDLRTYTNGSNISIVGCDTQIQDMQFTNNGSNLTIYGITSDKFCVYRLSIPWNLSTAVNTYNSTSWTLDTGIRTFNFMNDGSGLIMLGAAALIYQYDLTIKYNVSNQSKVYLYNASSNPPEAGFEDLMINPNGTRIYLLGISTDNLYSREVKPAFNISNWPKILNRKTITNETAVRGVAYCNGSNRIMHIGDVADIIVQFNLTEYRELQNAVYHRTIFNVSSLEPLSQDIEISENGLNMYFVGQTNDRIHWYELTTKCLLDSRVYRGNLSITSEDGQPSAMKISIDGTKLYTVGQANDRVRQWNMSIAYNITTAVSDRAAYVGSQDGTPAGIDISDDGKTMIMLGNTNDIVVQYNLSKEWYVNSSTYYGVNTSIYMYDGLMEDVEFSPNGTGIYTVGANNDLITYIPLLNEPTTPSGGGCNCTITPTGNAAINCSCGCTLSQTNMARYNLTISGTGSTYGFRNVTNTTRTYIMGACKAYW